MPVPRGRWLLLLGVLGMLPVPARGVEPLQWKWTPGERLRLEVRQQMQQVWTSGESQTEISSELTMGWLLVVEDVSHDGQASVVQRLERVQAVSDIPPVGRVEFDSQATQPPQGLARPLAQFYKPLIGQEIRLTIDIRGQVAQMQVPEVLANANPLLRAVAGENGWAGPVLVFPAEPMQPGYAWKSERTVRLAGMGARLVTTYRYVGPVVQQDRQVEEFDIGSTLTLDPAPSALTLRQHSLVGKLWFDAQAGRLVGGQVRQELTVQSGPAEALVDQTTINSTEIQLALAPPEPPAGSEVEGESGTVPPDLGDIPALTVPAESRTAEPLPADPGGGAG